MTTPRPAHAQTPGSSSSSIPRSLDRQKVLDEDEYTAALSHIIARDFFPSLVHLDATNEYLDSVQSKNPSLIEASVRRLESLSTPATRQRERAPNQTPSQTPYTYGPSDTPLPYRTPRDATTGESSSKRPRFDANMSLDAFQAQYTSEDNASFTQILEDENQKRKEAYSWAWDAQRRVEAAKARSLEMKARMMIEGPVMPGVKGKLLIEPPLPTAGLLTAAGEEMDVDEHEEALDDLREEREVALVLVEAEQEEPVSTVSTVPTAVARRDEAVVDVMAPQKDTRSAGVDGWHFKVYTTCQRFEYDVDTMYRQGTP
jgi:protein DGCR14